MIFSPDSYLACRVEQGLSSILPRRVVNLLCIHEVADVDMIREASCELDKASFAYPVLPEDIADSLIR